MESSKNDLFEERVDVAEPVKNPRSRQSQLGQYFTPEGISAFMAGLFGPLPPKVRLLDPGAGSGALTTAFVTRARQIGYGGFIRVVAFEKDDHVLPDLGAAMKALDDPAVESEVRAVDFVRSAATSIKLGRGDRYTHCIMNPPYMKIGTDSDARGMLRAIGLETVNMYSGFVGLALDLVAAGGELVAIIPRSFCNGPYYQPFRKFIFKRAAIVHIHLFESRNKAFKSDGVLQENIIIHLKRDQPQGDVKVSTSTDGTFSDYEESRYDYSKIVYPDDDEQFIHIPTAGANELLASHAFAHKLKDLGLSVSTGPVVDFRMRHDMCEPGDADAVPLLYSSHFVDDDLVWPKENFKKSNAIRRDASTEKWFYPLGFYSVIRRFSSKEERRRIVASLLDPAKLPGCEVIGFENHLNVIHQGKRPLPEDIARGITVYLNCTAVDLYFRRFNGHTQVNATDLRTMRFPSLDALRNLGAWSKQQARLTQEQIDAKVDSLA
jgi:adenine-specific DNA-methyltransferase